MKQKLVNLFNRIFKNSIVTFSVGSKAISIRRDHELRGHIKRYPQYSQNIIHISEKVAQKYPTTTFLDIGANIGDTVAFVRNVTDLPVACIEGNESFFSILQKNAVSLKNIDIYKLFLGERQEIVHARPDLQRKGSFGISTEHDMAYSFSMTTLDDFIKNNKKYSRSKFLKIDTDGYDLKIIRGAKVYISSVSPVIFFEFSRTYIEKQDEDGMQVFKQLANAGYTKVLFYDNYGRLAVSANIENPLLSQLYLYSRGRSSAVPFWDVCAFHQSDEDIFQALAEKEAMINK